MDSFANTKGKYHIETFLLDIQMCGNINYLLRSNNVQSSKLINKKNIHVIIILHLKYHENRNY